MRLLGANCFTSGKLHHSPMHAFMKQYIWNNIWRKHYQTWSSSDYTMYESNIDWIGKDKSNVTATSCKWYVTLRYRSFRWKWVISIFIVPAWFKQHNCTTFTTHNYHKDPHTRYSRSVWFDENICYKENWVATKRYKLQVSSIMSWKYHRFSNNIPMERCDAWQGLCIK